MTNAARDLGVWPTTIQPIERRQMRDHEAINRFRDWIEQKALINA
ncbi:hypothetical protein [Arthrobacter sp. 179]